MLATKHGQHFYIDGDLFTGFRLPSKAPENRLGAQQQSRQSRLDLPRLQWPFTSGRDSCTQARVSARSTGQLTAGLSFVGGPTEVERRREISNDGDAAGPGFVGPELPFRLKQASNVECPSASLQDGSKRCWPRRSPPPSPAFAKCALPLPSKHRNNSVSGTVNARQRLHRRQGETAPFSTFDSMPSDMLAVQLTRWPSCRGAAGAPVPRARSTPRTGSPGRLG